MSWKILNTATKWINKTLNFSDLLKSRIVLYIFFFLSLVNLYTLTINGNGLYAGIFILTSFLTTFFSKNMIVVLCIGLVVSNILRQGIEIRNVQEGMSTEKGVDKKENMKEGISDLDEEEDLISKKDNSDDEGGSDEPEPADEEQLNERNREYKKLLELQNKLIEGVSTMTPLLNQAKEAFQKIKDM
jgi:hypothetical protein